MDREDRRTSPSGGQRRISCDSDNSQPPRTAARGSKTSQPCKRQPNDHRKHNMISSFSVFGWERVRDNMISQPLGGGTQSPSIRTQEQYRARRKGTNRTSFVPYSFCPQHASGFLCDSIPVSISEPESHWRWRKVDFSFLLFYTLYARWLLRQIFSSPGTYLL